MSEKTEPTMTVGEVIAKTAAPFTVPPLTTEDRLAEFERMRERTIPTRYRYHNLIDHPNRELRVKVRQWIEAWQKDEATSLILTGQIGSGKTSAAVSACREITRAEIERGENFVTVTHFVSYGQWLSAMRSEYREEVADALHQASECTILILDDVGAEHQTEYGLARTYELISSRYNNCLATIITTNLGIEQLRESLGDRIVDRLLTPGFIIDAIGNFRS